MLLPGRLRSTTLGDLLGTLLRARAHGTLELVEDRGRTHRIHVASGLVAAVEIDGASASLAEILRGDRGVDDDTLRRSLLRAMASRRLHGDVLTHDFQIAPSVVGRALRRQLIVRLAALERLGDARVHFRVTLRAPRSALSEPLRPVEYLHGRRRARDAQRACSPRPPPASVRAPSVAPSGWDLLGVSPGADPVEIRRAYRRLARELHPDLHPRATEEQRRALSERFAAVTAAYRALVA